MQVTRMRPARCCCFVLFFLLLLSLLSLYFGLCASSLLALYLQWFFGGKVLPPLRKLPSSTRAIQQQKEKQPRYTTIHELNRLLKAIKNSLKSQPNCWSTISNFKEFSTGKLNATLAAAAA